MEEAKKSSVILTKLLDTYKLVVSEETEKKIRYTCKQIWDKEWSGILFYKPKGTFEDGSLVIESVDIFVMDIGKVAFTSFMMSPEVIGYMSENPELLDCQLGLIHSHNNMSTFFSGEDTNTLRVEGSERNHFVSLIVNNKGEYTAGITRRIKHVTEHISYDTFGDQEVTSEREYVPENIRVEWFELRVEIEGEVKCSFDDIHNRLEELKSRKNVKVASTETMVKAFKEVASESEVHHRPYTTQAGNTYDELPFQECGKVVNIAYQYIDNAEMKKDALRSLLLQLITGSIVVSNTSKIDLDKWVKNMVTIYDKRFGTGEKDLKIFSRWADEYIEFLCWTGLDDILEGDMLNDEEAAVVRARDLIKELSKLQQNKYIRIYIDLLNDIIDGYCESYT